MGEDRRAQRQAHLRDPAGGATLRAGGVRCRDTDRQGVGSPGGTLNESHDSDCQDRNRSVPEDYFRLAVEVTNLTSQFDTREATRIVEACAEAKQHGFWDELSGVKKRKPRKVGPKKSRKRVRK